MTWEDEDFDVNKGFVKNLEEEVKISLNPPSPIADTKATSQLDKQRVIQSENALAEMEDFFNGGNKAQDDSIVKSKFMPSPTQITPGDLQNELKTNIKEAQTIDDYLRISQQIVSIITIAKESEHYTKFLTSIIRDCTSGMSGEDIKSITANMSAKAAKKYKKQKPVIKIPKRNLNIENLYDNYHEDDDLYGENQDDIYN